jgi:hypothetical protein
VDGTEPSFSHWRDVRAKCIAYGRTNNNLDRRVWTWELRLSESPLANEVECLIVSPEMHKRLELLRLAGIEIPDSLRILPGTMTGEGIHWFATEYVHAAFLGSAA